MQDLLIADTVRAYGLTPANWMDKAKHAAVVPQFIEMFSGAVTIKADNVAEYFFAQTTQEEWEIERDFPSLTPPFPRFIVDMGRPTQIKGTKEPIDTRILPIRTGVLFLGSKAEKTMFSPTNVDAYRKDQKEQLDKVLKENPRFAKIVNEAIQEVRATDPKEIQTMMSEFPPAMQSVVLQLIEAAGIDSEEEIREKVRKNCEEFGDKTKYVVSAFVYGQTDKKTVIGPMSGLYFMLDAAGAVIGPPARLVLNLENEKLKDDPDKALVSFVYAACLAVSLMHCKNVRVDDRGPSRNQSREYREKFGQPMTTFKTLHIDPMRQILAKSGPTNQTLKQALHICRGHFKDFRQSGLFGKHKGVYWWNSTVKGNVERGVVQKDYSVDAPK